MCLSQPIVAGLSYVLNRKSLILASVMILGVGSLVCESTSAMALLLTGRTIQGIGAGGLMVLSYALCVDLKPPSGPRFLAAISLFIAAGTVCGPFVGAALSDHHHWVVAASILQNLMLTIASALDFSTKHPHVSSAWCASVQRQRRP
jgi:MFS family permease